MRTGLAKIIVLAALAGLSAAPSLRSEGVGVRAGEFRGWGSERLIYNRQAEFTGDRNYYSLNYLQYKPDRSGRTETFVHLSAPRMRFGFGREPIDFLSLSVNGIPLRAIQPTPRDFSVGSGKDRAGAVFAFNFDGARILMEAAMRPGSPLLFLTFRPAAEQLEPVRSVSVRVSAVVSKLLTGEKGTIWNGPYHRRAETAVRSLVQRRDPFELAPGDRYLILSDDGFAGRRPDGSDGFGPSYIAFDAPQARSVRLSMDNCWITRLELDLDPGFQCCRLAIWQHANAMSNEEFMRMFRKERRIFSPFEKQ